MSFQIQWVRGENPCGCGIATLAMVTGQTYAQVAADFAQPLEDGANHDLNRVGVTTQTMDRYLAERGYAVCRLYLRDLFKERPVWPPEPFAEVHLCSVKVAQSDRAHHSVVMRHDGSVLDPNHREPGRLTDYYQVYSVAGVVRLQTHPYQSGVSATDPLNGSGRITRNGSRDQSPELLHAPHMPPGIARYIRNEE